MIAAKKKPEPSRLDKIRTLADEIKGHQERMLELIAEEAAIDKAACPGLPLVMLEQDILKYGRCPCDAVLVRLARNAEAAERDANG
jgi:hypothetical protein